MSRADYFALGDWNTVCYDCGRKFKASVMKRNWQGFYECPEHWTPRQPQDFVRSVPDVQVVPWAQPQNFAARAGGISNYFLAATGSTSIATFTSTFTVTDEEVIDLTVTLTLTIDGVIWGPYPVVTEVLPGVETTLGMVIISGEGTGNPRYGWAAVGVGILYTIASEPTDLVVPPDDTASSITVTVTEIVEGSPVAGVTVVLTDTQGIADVTPASVITDSNGQAVFTISSSAAGTATFMPSISDVEFEEGEVAVTFAIAEFYIQQNSTTVLGLDLQGNVAVSLAAGGTFLLRGTRPDYYYITANAISFTQYTNGTISGVNSTNFGLTASNMITSNLYVVGLGQSATNPNIALCDSNLASVSTFLSADGTALGTFSVSNQAYYLSSGNNVIVYTITPDYNATASVSLGYIIAYRGSGVNSPVYAFNSSLAFIAGSPTTHDNPTIYAHAVPGDTFTFQYTLTDVYTVAVAGAYKFLGMCANDTYLCILLIDTTTGEWVSVTYDLSGVLPVRLATTDNFSRSTLFAGLDYGLGTNAAGPFLLDCAY